VTGIPSHGAPTLLDDRPRLRQLSGWCRRRKICPPPRKSTLKSEPDQTT
jgi:hypothetical protein